MSCKHCESTQLNYHSRVLSKAGNPEVFVRIGNGNVQIIACETHTAQTISLIREAQQIHDTV